MSDELKYLAEEAAHDFMDAVDSGHYMNAGDAWNDVVSEAAASVGLEDDDSDDGDPDYQAFDKLVLRTFDLHYPGVADRLQW